MEGRGEQCRPISLQGTRMGTSSAPEPDAGMCLGAGAPTHGVDGDGLPRETQPTPWPQGLGKDPCPCGSSLQRVKDVAVHWPLCYHQEFELSPAAQGKQRGGAKQRSQWKGRVSRARGQILPVKASWPPSSPVPPTDSQGKGSSASAGQQGCAPRPCLGLLGAVAMELLQVLGQMGDAFGLCHNPLFRPLTILSVLGLIRLIFAPWFALEMAPPFPGR